MKIDILADSGSPLGTHYIDLFGEGDRLGLGGAEQALHTMCHYWFTQGHDITLYNSPTNPVGSPYKQKNVHEFRPEEERDILIVFRVPTKRIAGAKGKKIWWSCDQYTTGSYPEFATRVDQIVCISPRHAQYFAEQYQITNVTVIDLPVRSQDYNLDEPKVPNQLIFCSIPARGLAELSLIFPAIVHNIPEVKLVITSSWTLWDNQNHEHHLAPYRLKFTKYAKNVDYRGGIKRAELCKLQAQSQIQAYPSVYDELFCISTAECSVAGAYPITSDCGALATTNMGTILPGSPQNSVWRDQFLDTVLFTLRNPELPKMQKELQKKALERFDINKIGEAWQKFCF